MTTHSQRAMILYRRRRFINHLFTYLLTYFGATRRLCGLNVCSEVLTFLRRRSPKDWKLRRGICSWYTKNDLYTTRWWMMLERSVETTGWLSWNRALPWANRWPCTTVSTTHSKFTCLVILSSPDQFIFWCPGSVAYLVCAAKGFLDRWTFWLMRPISSVRGQTPWCPIWITFFKISD